MKRLTRKRLMWILALMPGCSPWMGAWHHERYGGHAWKADPADRADRERRHRERAV